MQWTDERVDIAIGNLLRVGVGLAAAIVLGAGLWYLVAHGQSRPDYSKFRGEPAELRSLTGVAGALPHGHAVNWIQFGLLLLIATPVARVAFSIFAFAVQRDWVYVVVTLIVLAILTYSLTSSG